MTGASTERLGAVCSYQGSSSEQWRTAVASGVEVADVLEWARLSWRFWWMRLVLASKDACSGRRGAAVVRRNRRRRQRCSSLKFTQPGGREGEASEGKERGDKGD